MEVAERFADGLATREDLSGVAEAAGWAVYAGASGAIAAANLAVECSLTGTDPVAHARATAQGAIWDAERAEAWRAMAIRNVEERHQALLIRDVCGPLPFRSILFAPAWRTSTVEQLAASIYEARAFDRLPILADALEEAGCTDREILKHCRQPREHCRGCWVVDLILGKE